MERAGNDAGCDEPTELRVGANFQMSDVERTPAGLQMVIPGCERRTLPKSTSRVDGAGQGLLGFYKPPSLRERLETGVNATLAVEQRAEGNAGKWSV